MKLHNDNSFDFAVRKCVAHCTGIDGRSPVARRQVCRFMLVCRTYILRQKLGGAIDETFYVIRITSTVTEFPSDTSFALFLCVNRQYRDFVQCWC